MFLFLQHFLSLFVALWLFGLAYRIALGQCRAFLPGIPRVLWLSPIYIARLAGGCAAALIQWIARRLRDW